MAFIRTILLTTGLVIIGTTQSWAEDKSYYSPVIYVDVENHRVLISKLGGVFYIDVPEVARPHMDKLPVSGLVDFVVETRGENDMPVIKTWKVKSGESACKYFNGKECK